MELDPITTNDQRDNERLVRYLKLSTGIKRRAGKWFCQCGHEADQKGVQRLSCGVRFPAQYTDWVDEMHIEQRLSGDFDEI